MVFFATLLLFQIFPIILPAWINAVGSKLPKICLIPPPDVAPLVLEGLALVGAAPPILGSPLTFPVLGFITALDVSIVWVLNLGAIGVCKVVLGLNIAIPVASSM